MYHHTKTLIRQVNLNLWQSCLRLFLSLRQKQEETEKSILDKVL